MNTKTTLFAIALTTAAGGCFAALQVDEPFAYTTGNIEGAAVSGAGLVGAWTSGYRFGMQPNFYKLGDAGEIVDTWTPSAPAGYAPAPSGNSYRSANSTLNAFAALAAPISMAVNSVTYISFFYRVAVAGNVATSYSQFGLTASNYANHADYFWFGKGSSSTTFSVKFGSGGTQPSAVDIQPDTDYLVVLKLTSVAGGADTLQFSVFTSVDTLAEPAVWDFTYSAAIEEDVSFNGVAIRQGAAQTELRVDEIRIGGSWEAVTSEGGTEPEPEWAGYPWANEDGDVDTGAFLGWVNAWRAPWIWVYSPGRFIYADGARIGADGGWVYVPR